MTLYDATEAGIAPPRPSDRMRAAARVRAKVWPRRTFLVAIFGVLSVAAIAAAVWPLTGTVVPWDSKNQFYPMFRFLGDAVRHGTVPLWNPYQFGGYPTVADPQSLLFTPTLLAFALIAPDASMQVFDAVVFAHLAMGGIGVLGLARRWRWHPSAGVLAAFMFMLGGAASSRLEHTGMIVSYAWYPLALWSLQAALDRRSLRMALVAALFATLMAIGRDQVAYLLCLALVGAVARQALRSDDWLSYLRSRAPVLLLSGAVTALVMLVPILLALQFVRDSNRPGIAYGMALAGSLDPTNMLTLLAPNVFGSLGPSLKGYYGPGAATLAGNDWTDPPVDYLFAGTLPFVLLIWHGLAGGRLLERGARYVALLMGAALLYAFGRHTPVFSFVFDWLPGVSLYRRPADASFLFNIALAFASGYMLHRYVEEGSPRLSLAFWPSALLPIVTALALAWLVGAGLAFARQAGHLATSIVSLVAASILCAGVVAALALLRAPQRRKLAATVLVAATAGQLVWRNAASALNAEPASEYTADAVLSSDEARGLATLRRDLDAHAPAGIGPRVEIQGIDGPWQNAAEIFKLQNVAGYNPLRIAAYERAVGIAESSNDAALRSFPDTFRGYNSRLAALLGLGYLVLDGPLADLPRSYPRPRATLLFGSPHFNVYRLDSQVVPRAHLAAHVASVDSDDIIDNGELPDFDLTSEAVVDQADIDAIKEKSVVLDQSDGPPTRPNPAPETGATSRITAYGPNRVTVEIDTPRAGILVLHDILYPGWVATVDGRAERILRTDLLFRGVEVPAGHHTVEFAFQPFAMRNLAAAARSLVKGRE